MVGWSHDQRATTYRLVPPGHRRRRAGRARRRPAARRRPRGRPAARAGRARHRQDDDAGRGDRRPDRAPRRRPDAGARADLLPQGRRAAPRPGHRPARPHDRRPRSARRSTPSPTAWSGATPRRALRRAAAAAVALPSRTSSSRSCSPTPPSPCAGPRRSAAAVGTRGFAREVHAVLSRARERGLDPDDLRRARPRARASRSSRSRRLLPAAVPRRPRRPDRHRLPRPDRAARRCAGSPTTTATSCAARFTPRLRRRVPGHRPRPGRPAARARRRRPRPDRASATPTSRSTASAAPTCAASSTSPPTFPRADGEPAPRRRARHHPPLRLAPARAPRGRRRLDRRCTGVDPAGGVRGVPRPAADAAELGPGRVEVLTFDTARAETEHVADLLRRAHLEDGIGWSDMAVLVRSGRTSIPALRRSLRAAGVPVEVAARRHAAGPRAGGAAAARRAARRGRRRRRRPGRPGVRRSPRDRRGAAHLAARRPRRHRRPRSWPGRCALASRSRPRRRADAAPVPRAGPRGGRSTPGSSTACDGERRRPPRAGRWPAAAHRPRPARRRRHRRGGALDALGRHRLGPAGCARRDPAGGSAARLAHRDLDADLSRCSRPPPGPRSSTGTPARRDVPRTRCAPRRSRPTPSPSRGVRGDAVRLLTAHRSKGLEWRLVVVAHVQEGAWPDLRRRATLLQADRIGRDGLLPPITTRAAAGRGAPAVLRRLHPRPPAAGRDRGRVARRRRRAAVPLRRTSSAATSPRTTSGPPAPPAVAGRSRRRAAAYRRRPERSPSRSARPRPRRLAAARRDRASHGRPVAPGADPATWWGTRARRAGRDQPVRPDDEPLRSRPAPSSGLLTCPAQWFLQREAGGERGQLHQARASATSSTRSPTGSARGEPVPDRRSSTT